MSSRCESASRLVVTVFVLASLFGRLYCQDTTTQGLKLFLLEDVVRGSVSVDVQQQRNISLVIGRSYNITCNRDGGFGGTSDVWLRDSNTITDRTGQSVSSTMPSVHTVMVDTNNWILVLQLFRASDAGNYTCRGADSSVTLRIGTNNPTVIASTPELSVSSRVGQGSRASLLAFVSGTPPPTLSDITWYFNNNQSIPTGSLIDDSVGGTELLLPRTLLPSHSGTYTIQVSTTSGTARDSFVVTVTAQPNPSISPMEKQVQVNGSSISLTCQDSRGVPAPTFVWNLNGNPLTDGGRIRISETFDDPTSSSRLTIDPLLRSDAGMFECIAANVDGSSSAFVSVDVHFRPIIEAFSTQLRWVVNSTATLQARLVEANPNTSLSFYWLDPSGVQISDTQYSRSTENGSEVYSLTLPDLKETSGGRYTCVVQNNISSSLVTFDLFVTIPPVLEHISGSRQRRTMLAMNGASQVMLVANVIKARPAIVADQVSWRDPNNMLIQQSAKYITTVRSSQVNLTLTSLSMVDSGVYTVTIDHEAGTVSLKFNLIVLDPPAPPTSLHATLQTACTAEIVWEMSSSQPSGTALPSFIVIEASLTMDITQNWVHVGRSDVVSGSGRNSLTGRIPAGGVNTMYWLRARSGNASVGVGSYFNQPTPFNAYTEDLFPTLSAVVGEPSSDSQTISVSWSLPSQDCFNTSFHISCLPLEPNAEPGENRVSQSLRSALVRNLTSNTFYNCSVTVSFDGFDRTSKIYSISPIVTFPLPPAPPGVKSFGGMKPTGSTITVQFSLPEDHETISHYRVYAIRLSSRSPPPVLPNSLYRSDNDSRLSTYDIVSEENPFEDSTSNYLGYIAAEIDAREFKPLFTIGDKSQTDVVAFANDKLHPSSPYTFFLRAYPKTRGDSPSRSKRQGGAPTRQYVVFSTSDFSDVLTTDARDPQTGGNAATAQDVAIGVVVGFVLVLLVTGIIVVIACLVFMVRSHNRRTYKPGRMPSIDNSPSSSCNGTPDFIIDTPDLGRKANGGHELKELDGKYFSKSPFIPSPPIVVDKFADHVETFDSDRQLLFQEEYEWISNNSPWNPAAASNHPLNDEKNRYSNITAFDRSRVELSLQDGIECSDYINANFISGFHSEEEYIATQGPLDQTVVDFWRMVWEQNCATIIMLTNLVELGKIKCAQYWPNSGKLIYGNIIVTLESTVNLPDYTIRNLTIVNMITGENRTVLQFHYTRWPDYHTPQLAAPLLNFLRAVNTSNPQNAGPMIVHCSAGVGRSGTVIAIDYCLHQLKAEGITDVRGFVSAMREQRNYMVQTSEQYTFIHYAILESITYGDTSFALTDFTSLYEKLRVVNPQSRKTKMDEEYCRLGQVKTMVKKSAFQRRLKRKGQPPRHFESSFRGTMPSIDANDNYSGHFVDSYFEKKRFIVAEGPQESTTAKFWQVVWDEDCSIVVMLTPQDSAQLYSYWPVVGEQTQHGNVIIEVESESEEHFYTKREIKLTNAKVDGISHKLEQYQFMGWMENTFPRVPDFVKFTCDVLDGVHDIESNKKVLIHDTNSLGPAGIMCALCYCVERLGVERMVDIFQAVQSIQLQRPGSIKTMTDYAFTYDCVYDYIRTYLSS